MPKQNILPMIAERFLNVPLLLEPSKTAVIYGVLQGRIAPEVTVEIADVDATDENVKPGATRFTGSRFGPDGKFSLVRRDKGVALIDITGSLVNRGAWIGASSGLTSYEGIGAQIDKAKADDSIHSAIIDLNSPGGEAGGMFSVAQKVRELAAVKRVVAVVNDTAASAAYGIASGAHEIVVSPTSMIGSIGVVMVHMDHSAELKKKGVKPTIFQKGANKTHGHPFGPVDAKAVAAIDDIMTTLYDQFLETVAAGRGDRLDVGSARATEAGVYMGQKAVDAGLADRIGTFDEVLGELQTNALSGNKTENVTMTDKTKDDPKAEGSNITQAQLDKSVADARAEGAAEATTRIGAILNCEEATGREATAKSLALDTDMTAEQAAKVLATTPIASGESTLVPTPEQRADDSEEIGAQDSGTQPEAGNGWDAVVNEINERAV